MNNSKKKKFLKRKPCFFCVEKMDYIDYKNVELLTKFVSVHGKIHPSRITDTCSRHQRLLATAVKRARIVALMPFIGERIRK